MSNAAAFAALDEQIKRIRELPEIAQTIAPAAAKELESIMRGNIAAGEAPDGKDWKLTEQGKQPLRNAAKALTVRAIGTKVLARLTGPEAKHNLGAVWGKIKRQILPDRRLPQAMTEALRRVSTTAYARLMGGSSG